MNSVNGFDGESEYSKNYSEKSLFDKIIKFAKNAGIKVIYAVLLLYFVLQKKDIPIGAKSVILGSLGYFILPTDVIPDLAPVIGYGDDFGVLAASLATVAMYIDDEVKENSRKKLKEWFGDYDKSSLNEVDDKF